MHSENCSVQAHKISAIYDGFTLSLPKNSRVLGVTPEENWGNREMLVLQDVNQLECEEREFFISFAENPIPFPMERLSLVGIFNKDYCLFEVCKE